MKNAWVVGIGISLLGSTTQAAFVAYNDCIGGGNPTNTTMVGSGQTGQLLDFASGTNTGASVQVVNNLATVGGAGASALFTAGSDAANMFNGKVDMSTSVIYYGTDGWYVDLIITGLDASKKYNFATSIDRGDMSPAPAGGYTDRWTVISLSDVDASTYAASTGAWKVSDSAVSIQSYNTVNGYIAQWTNIQPGADGDFLVHFTYATGAAGGQYPTGASQNGVRGYGPAGFMLEEQMAIPEPAGPSLLALGGAALAGRRRARR